MRGLAAGRDPPHPSRVFIAEYFSELTGQWSAATTCCATSGSPILASPAVDHAVNRLWTKIEPDPQQPPDVHPHGSRSRLSDDA